MTAFSASTANFTTTTVQGSGANWNATIWQPGAVAPSVGSTYECVPNGTAFGNNTGNTRVRNPAAAGVQTFVGDSLTLDANTEIRAKTVGAILNFPGVGGNPGLILNGGVLNAGDTTVFECRGSIQVASDSLISPGDNGAGGIVAGRGFKFNAVLSGPGSLYLIQGPINVISMEVASTNNTFSGNWVIKAGYLKGTSPGSLGSGNIIIDPNYVVPTTLVSASLTAGPAQFEVNYNISSTNKLTLANGGKMLLHQNCTFGAVNINGTELAPDVYTFDQLVALFPGNFATPGSGSITVTPKAPAPTGLAASAADSQISLSWNTVAGATSYVIARATSASGPYTRVATNGTASYLDTGLSNGTTYYYTVRTQVPAGESLSSNPVSATPNPPPDVPTGLATVNGDTMVTISWSAAARAQTYNIKRSTTSGGPYTPAGTTGNLSYMDNGLVNNTLYYYVVSAVNGAGESANSVEVSATPSQGPRNLTAAGGVGQISLAWEQLTGASTYNVKRASASGGPYTLIASGVTALTYLDPGLPSGSTFYYVVSGQLGAMESGNSAEAAAATHLGAPLNLVPTVVSNALRFRVDLAWSDSEPAVTSFKLERSGNGVDFSQIASLARTTTSFSDTNISPTFTYYYRVRGASSTDASDYSNVGTAVIPTLAVYVNFAITSFATNYPGYVNDYSLVYGLRTNGMTYGWDADNTANSRERNSAISPDKRYDTFTHMQKQVPARYWEIELPVGAYYVHMVSGDPTATDSVFKLDAEGVLTLDGVPTSVNNAYWVEGSNVVAVTDGRLTVSVNPATAGNTANNAKINYIDIVSVAPQAPTITNQPVSITATENDTVTLSVGAQGTSPLTYQWYFKGAPLVGKTGATLTLADVQLTNAGNYSVVVSNFVGTAASGSATLTVNQDNTAPGLVSASGDSSYVRVLVNFSERVAGVSATNIANYSIANGNGDPLPVLGALLLANGRTVQLTTATQTAGTHYTVTVNNVADISAQANQIAPNSQASFTAWTETACTLLVETFTDIGGTDIASLTNNSKFINNTPDIVGYVTSFSYTPNLDNYGARISGFFVPPSNGVYRFYIRSDDASMLFLNPDSADPAGKILIAREDTCCHAYGYNTDSISTEFPLNAGQRYYIEALVKEGGGGDYVQVAFREQGDPSIPASAASSTPVGSEVASGTAFTSLANPDIATLSVSIEPATPEVYENSDLTLKLILNYTPTNYPACIQWQRFDGGGYTNIPGATGATYTRRYTLEDGGAQFRAIVIIPGANGSADVAVNVVADTTPPTIVSVGSLDGVVIGVCFSEPIDLSSINDPFNWSVNGEENYTISTIGWSPDQRIAYLTNSVILSSATFTLKALSLVDRSASANTTVDARITGHIEHLAYQDVGVPEIDPLNAGSVLVCTNNVFNVTAGGSDIWNSSNAMSFLYTQLSNDFDVRVRVQSLDAVNQNSKAGIVATETLDPGSRDVNLVVTPSAIPVIYSPTLFGANNYQANYRATANGATAQWPIGGRKSGVPYPNAWLRLTRTANTFVAYQGTNGTDWYAFATNTVTPSYSSTLYVGMGVTSHDNTNGHTANAILSDWLVVSSPALLNVSYSAGSAGFDFASQDYVTYAVEYKDSLSAPAWTPLSTIAGDGGTKHVTDATAVGFMRYYRVRVQ